MERLDPDIIGCVTRDRYTVSRSPAMWRNPVLRGRTRYALKDMFASYFVDVVMQLTESQFASWQQFWDEAAGRGTKEFYMSLDLSNGVVEYPVRPVGEWSAAYVNPHLWSVSMKVEVPGFIAFDITICDVIYGGPLTNLSPDSIYGGPIDNLAPDVIAPCEEVLNG